MPGCRIPACPSMATAGRSSRRRLRSVLRRAQRDQIESFWFFMCALSRSGDLAAIAGRPAAAVDLAQEVLGRRHVVLDLDVLEHLVGEAELLGEQIHDLVIVLRFEDRLDDLLAPLQRAVRGGARAVHLELVRSAGGRCCSAPRIERREVVGCGSATTSSSSLLMPFCRLGDARHGVAAVAEHHHRLDVGCAGRPAPRAGSPRRTTASR